MDGETTLDITNTIATEERSIVLSTLTDSPSKAIVNISGMLYCSIITVYLEKH